MQYMETFKKAVENALQKAIDSHKIQIHTIEQGENRLEIKGFCEIDSGSWVRVSLNLHRMDLKKEGLI